MTTILQLFPTGVPIGWLGRGKDRQPIYASDEFQRSMGGLLVRVGGPSGASTTDLATSDDEDSGLEELRAEQWKHNDAVDLAPAPQFHVVPDTLIAEVSALREEVAQLRAQLEDISRGSLL